MRLTRTCPECNGEGAIERTPEQSPAGAVWDDCTRCGNAGTLPVDRVWVNAYAVSRHYGGPEEGGWYYDAGSPLASIPFAGDDDAGIEKARELLRAMFAADYEHERDRSSVLGGDNLEIYTEEHVAEPFPQGRPHYE